ncbi:unnamed protein product, partial [Musa textilis]
FDGSSFCLFRRRRSFVEETLRVRVLFLRRHRLSAVRRDGAYVHEAIASITGGGCVGQMGLQCTAGLGGSGEFSGGKSAYEVLGVSKSFRRPRQTTPPRPSFSSPLMR